MEARDITESINNEDYYYNDDTNKESEWGMMSVSCLVPTTAEMDSQ